MRKTRPLTIAVLNGATRLALAVAVIGALFLPAAQAVAAPGCVVQATSSVQEIAAEVEAMEGEKTGRIAVDVYSDTGGRITVLTAVFERLPLAQVYTFLDNCLVSATNAVPAAFVVDRVNRKPLAAMFGPDRGL